MILGNLTRIRNLLKHELIKRGVKNFWVLDPFAIVGNAKLADHEEVINHLAVISDDDGVHYSLLGYETLAKEIMTASSDLMEGKIGQAGLRTKDGQPKPLKFFWRGFLSRYGSALRKHQAAPFGRSLAKPGGRVHPYRRN